MGCTQSKIENEEAVSRCKDRKLFMKEAVSARNAFAAAHSSYAIYLKNTGAALSDYAQGEVAQHPAQAHLSAVPIPQAPLDPFPPPPPLPNFASTAPLQRAASMPEMIKPDPNHSSSSSSSSKPKPKPIIEDEDEDADDDVIDAGETLKRRTRSRSDRGVVHEDLDAHAPPPIPSPPPSVESRTVPPLPQHHDTPYDYFFSVDMPASSLAVPPEPRDQESAPPKVFEERPKRVVEEVVELKRSSKVVAEEEEEEEEEVEVVVKDPTPPPPPPVEVVDPVVPAKLLKKVGQKGSVNLLQIFADIDDHFLRASQSAHEVSKMLEATRLHYHSNFADNRGK